MLVRHHHDGKVHMEVPVGSRGRRSLAAGESGLYIPPERGGEVLIFVVPGELFVQVARVERYGLWLFGVVEMHES